jgi:hypothetical protein
VLSALFFDISAKSIGSLVYNWTTVIGCKKKNAVYSANIIYYHVGEPKSTSTADCEGESTKQLVEIVVIIIIMVTIELLLTIYRNRSPHTLFL